MNDDKARGDSSFHDVRWNEVPPPSEGDYRNIESSGAEDEDFTQLPIKIDQSLTPETESTQDQSFDEENDVNVSAGRKLGSREDDQSNLAFEDAMSKETNSDVVELMMRVKEFSASENEISRPWLVSELEALQEAGKIAPGHPLLGYLNNRNDETLSLGDVLAYQVSSYFLAQQTSTPDVSSNKPTPLSNAGEGPSNKETKTGYDKSNPEQKNGSALGVILEMLREKKSTGEQLRLANSTVTPDRSRESTAIVPITDFESSVRAVGASWQKLQNISDSAQQSILVDRIKDDLSRACSAAASISDIGGKGISDADVDRLRLSLHALEDIQGQLKSENGLEQSLKEKLTASIADAVEAAQGISELMNQTIEKLMNNLSSTSAVEP